MTRSGNGAAMTAELDFTSNATLHAELFSRYASGGAEPSVAETRPIVDRAVRLVLDGMPLTEAMASLRLQSAPMLSGLFEPAHPEATTELVNRFGDYLELVLSRIAETLITEIRQPDWDKYESRREIAASLLSGADPSDVGTFPRACPAETYHVGVLRSRESSSDALHDLRTRAAAIPGAMLHRDNGMLVALLPGSPSADADPVDAITVRLGLPRRSERLGADCWLGIAPPARHADIPAAYAEARVVAETARCLSRPEIVVSRREILFEYATATMEPGARSALAAVLTALDGQPILEQTLETFIGCGGNANGAARDLYVHRNTIAYRLGRIADLTGYDPQQPAGISVLATALVARRLENNAFRP